MINKLIISAPFGNYFNCEGITSTIGTYTLYPSGGIRKIIWKILTTVKYDRKNQSWINELGLPNPGIDSIINENISNKILNIYGSNDSEWFILVHAIMKMQTPPAAIELNLSCPNVKLNTIKKQEFDVYKQTGIPIIAKLPPIKWMDYVIPLKEVGVNYFHLCNTIPSPGGGISGKVLKQYSLWAVEEAKQKYGNDVKVIGGGGITEIKDIDDYLEAGADHVSVGSMLFNPLNWRKLKIFRDYLNNESNI